MNSTAHIKIPTLPDNLRLKSEKAVLTSRTPIVTSYVPVPATDVAPLPAPAATELSEEAYHALKSDIGEVLAASADANANERVVVVITLCICAGVNTAGWIIEVAKNFGFKRGHVGSLLTNSAVGRSKTPIWRRDAEGRFSMLG